MNKSRVLLHLSLMLLTVPFVYAEEEEAVEVDRIVLPILDTSTPTATQMQDLWVALKEKTKKESDEAQQVFQKSLPPFITDLGEVVVARVLDCLAQVEENEREKVISNLKSMIAPDMSSADKSFVLGLLSFVPSNSHSLETYRHMLKIYPTDMSKEKKDTVLILLSDLQDPTLSLKDHQQFSNVFCQKMDEELRLGLILDLAGSEKSEAASILSNLFSLYKSPKAKDWEIESIFGITSPLSNIEENRREDVIRDTLSLFTLDDDDTPITDELGRIVEFFWGT